MFFFYCFFLFFAFCQSTGNIRQQEIISSFHKARANLKCLFCRWSRNDYYNITQSEVISPIRSPNLVFLSPQTADGIVSLAPHSLILREVMGDSSSWCLLFHSAVSQAHTLASSAWHPSSLLSSLVLIPHLRRWIFCSQIIQGMSRETLLPRLTLHLTKISKD